MQSKSPIASKYLTKSKNAAHEMQSYQSRRHNFIGKQVEANDGVLPITVQQDFANVSQGAVSRTSSNNRSALAMDRSRSGIRSTNDRSTILMPSDMATTPQQSREFEAVNINVLSSGEKRRRWEQSEPEPVDLVVDEVQDPIVEKPRRKSQRKDLKGQIVMQKNSRNTANNKITSARTQQIMAARNSATPQPVSEQTKSTQPTHQQRKSSHYQQQPPEEWTAKLNSDDFLRQWYSAKCDPLQQSQTIQLDNESKSGFPPEAEEKKSEQKPVSKKTAMLSKFLTSAAQPKVESTSPLSRPKIDQNLYETSTTAQGETPSNQPTKKASRPNQRIGQQSLLQSRLRLNSNQPSASSLFTTNGPTSMTNQSAATTHRATTARQQNLGDTRKSINARQNFTSTSSAMEPSFKPEINKKSTKITQQKAPIFSNERYQKELEERNQKMEMLKMKRQAELQEKEIREKEEVAKRSVHKPGQKLDLNNFQKSYAEKMENMQRRKQEKQEAINREKAEGQTFAPAINNYSRKIAQAGGIANVTKARKETPAGMPTVGNYPSMTQNSGRVSMISESQPTISAAVTAQGPILQSARNPNAHSISPMKSSLQRLKDKQKTPATAKKPGHSTNRDRKNQTPRLNTSNQNIMDQSEQQTQPPNSARTKFNKYINSENGDAQSVEVQDRPQVRPKNSSNATDHLMQQIRKKQIRLEAQKFQQQPLDPTESNFGQLTFISRRTSDISNHSRNRSRTPDGDSRLSQKRPSLLMSSQKQSTPKTQRPEVVVSQQLKTNLDRQSQIEQKAAQVNQMFAQMLEKCGTTAEASQSKTAAGKKHNFRGASSSQLASSDLPMAFIKSKSEVNRPAESERLTLQSEEDNFGNYNEGQAAGDQNFGYDFQEDNSSPFTIASHSASGVKKVPNRLRTVVGVEGTGGGFSQIGNEESGLIDSDAQEFLMLEQQTHSDITPRGERVSGHSSSSMRYSALRASFPSQSGATKMATASVLKPTKTPTKSLLGRYNQNLAKHSARTQKEQ